MKGSTSDSVAGVSECVSECIKGSECMAVSECIKEWREYLEEEGLLGVLRECKGSTGSTGSTGKVDSMSTDKPENVPTLPSTSGKSVKIDESANVTSDGSKAKASKGKAQPKTKVKPQPKAKVGVGRPKGHSKSASVSISTSEGSMSDTSTTVSSTPPVLLPLSAVPVKKTLPISIFELEKNRTQVHNKTDGKDSLVIVGVGGSTGVEGSTVGVGGSTGVEGSTVGVEGSTVALDTVKGSTVGTIEVIEPSKIQTIKSRASKPKASKAKPKPQSKPKSQPKAQPVVQSVLPTLLPTPPPIPPTTPPVVPTYIPHTPTTLPTPSVPPTTPPITPPTTPPTTPNTTPLLSVGHTAEESKILTPKRSFERILPMLKVKRRIDRPNQSFAGLKPEELKEKSIELTQLLKGLRGVVGQYGGVEGSANTVEKSTNPTNPTNPPNTPPHFSLVIDSSDDEVKDPIFTKKRWVDSPSLPRRLLLQDENQATEIFGTTVNTRVNLKEMFDGVRGSREE